MTLPSLAVSGAKGLADSGELAYRIVPVIFGLGLIPLLALLADGLGRTAAIAAALLTAISPAMVFFSRYYIQETLLVFFMLAVLGFGWRYARSRRMGWVLAAGAAVGMMYATKETWILSAAAAVLAAGLTWGWSRLYDPQVPGPNSPSRATCLRVVLHVLAGVLMACFVAGAFFSMFGRHWAGPWESIRAYANYFHRGSQGGEHAEPWYYYLQILFAYRPSKRIFWSEGMIAALALLGAISALRLRVFASPSIPFSSPSPALLRFLTFFAFLLTLLYSLVNYKTPWCALSFLMGMILLAGVGAAVFVRIAPNWPLKLLAATLLAVGAGHLDWESWQLNFNPRYLADPSNPYVYAHTPMPLPKLGARLDRLAERVPQGRDLWIQVVVPENYWPLPWYLRRFDERRIGYWLDPNVWKEERDRFPPPAILILGGDVESDGLAAGPVEYCGPVNESLRPGVLIRVYVRKDLWPIYIECQNEKAAAPKT